MTKAPWKTLATAVASTLLVLGAGAQPAVAFQLEIHPPTGRNWFIDVESSSTIGDAKQKIADRSTWPAALTCIVFANKALLDERTLSEYNIPPGATFPWFTLPVAASWSVTPDEPLRDGVVHNNVETKPPGTHFEVVDGALPAGVTLDPDTGVVDGTFTEAGAFSATIRATNVCGVGDLTWTGTVPAAGSNTESNELPNTGVSGAFAAMLGICATALLIMGSLLAFQRGRLQQCSDCDVRPREVASAQFVAKAPLFAVPITQRHDLGPNCHHCGRIWS